MMQQMPLAFASSRRRAGGTAGAPEPEEAAGAAAATPWSRESIARDDGGVVLATEAEAKTTQAKNLARMQAIVRRFKVPSLLELQTGDT